MTRELMGWLQCSASRLARSREMLKTSSTYSSKTNRHHCDATLSVRLT
jgi:hypothetical protein